MTLSYANFNTYLEKISHRGIQRGIERMTEALEKLGRPDRSYKIIHIAGTNGKGSTCTFLAQILAQSGYKVGMTLSPHVYDYRERIQIVNPNLQMIPVDDLMATHEKLMAFLPETLLFTYFEWTILLAFQYFADQGVDFAIIETGLGGRLDATNACTSILSGITTIGFDHMNYLGNTLEKILTEKLQIIKPKSDFLFGPQESSLVHQAISHCEQVGAHFHHVVQPVNCKTYLEKNFVFALTLAELLKKQGHKIKTESLSFSDFKTPPARLEILSKDPLIFMDGAHNSEGLLALKAYLKDSHSDRYTLIFGCVNDRDFLSLARLIRSEEKNLWALFNAGPRTTPRKEYDKVIQELGGQIVELNENLMSLLKSENFAKPIVVCGSFYLCSEFVRIWKLFNQGKK